MISGFFFICSFSSPPYQDFTLDGERAVAFLDVELGEMTVWGEAARPYKEGSAVSSLWAFSPKQEGAGAHADARSPRRDREQAGNI